LAKFLLSLFVTFAIIAILAHFFSPYTLNNVVRANKKSHFTTISKSVESYSAEAIGDFEMYSLTYWGNFGWINAPISTNILRFIWLIEIICAIGLVIFLVRKKNPEFLPSKTVVVALIVIFVALQFGVRFADWAAFNNRGIIIYGTSGRYFMPALFAHLILLIVGAGAWAKREALFSLILKIALVAMVSLFFYSMFSVIIPRYYL
jgi:hypothetical protein